MMKSGRSWIGLLVAIDDEVCAIAGFGDPLRSNAKSTINALQRRGWRVGVVSGDAKAIVEQVGAALGIDPTMRIAGAAPEEKMARVQSRETPRPM